MKEEMMIKLTVGLPMFRAEHIGWLALESLCRQEKPSCKWELIIAEEVDKKYLPVGLSEISKYKKRLEAVGCIRVKYIKLQSHIALLRKWCLIAKNASATSIGFIIQAADGYCGRERLLQAEKLFDKGARQIYSTCHQIYNLKDGNIYVLPARNVETAYDMKIFKTITPIDRYTKVDGYIFAQLKGKIGNKTIVDKSDYWKTALTTHGLNNISGDKRIRKATVGTVCLEDIVPKDIAERLVECKEYAKTWGRYGARRD